MAASVAPIPVMLRIEGDIDAICDDDLDRAIFVPGLQHAGGISAVRALIAANLQSARKN